MKNITTIVTNLTRVHIHHTKDPWCEVGHTYFIVQWGYGNMTAEKSADIAAIKHVIGLNSAEKQPTQIHGLGLMPLKWSHNFFDLIEPLARSGDQRLCMSKHFAGKLTNL